MPTHTPQPQPQPLRPPPTFQPPPTFTCGRCDRTSSNFGDVVHRFCGFCGIFATDPAIHNSGAEGIENHKNPVLARSHFLEWLRLQGYMSVRLIDDQHYAALRIYGYTVAIITGDVGDREFIGNRWCYGTHQDALAALDAWDGTTGEPAGWRRHPSSGRRRAEGPGHYDQDNREVEPGTIYRRW